MALSVLHDLYDHVAPPNVLYFYFACLCVSSSLVHLGAHCSQENEVELSWSGVMMAALRPHTLVTVRSALTVTGRRCQPCNRIVVM